MKGKFWAGEIAGHFPQ